LQQVARALQREVSQAVLTELKDPRIGFVTVTRVEPAADLRTARVYVSVLGDEKAEALTLHGLRHAAGRIQALVGERLQMRHFPVLEFWVDASVKAAFRLSRLLEENKGERAGSDEGPASGGKAPEDG